MITLVLAIGVTRIAGVASAPITPTANDANGSSITGVAKALASRKFRATRPTMSTTVEKRTSVGTAARYVSDIAPTETLNSFAAVSSMDVARLSTSAMLI